MALLPNSRPFGCSTLAFLFLSLKTFFPTSPSSREAGFLRLLGAPWDAQFAFLPIVYFFRFLPFGLGGIRCFRVTSICHPCLFCFSGCSPWESTQFLLKDFQADTFFAGCAALVLLLAVGPDVFHGQGCFPMLLQMGLFK